MRSILLALIILAATTLLAAQNPWPRSFDTRGYTFTLYTPETTGSNGLTVTGRLAFSIASSPDNTVFGALGFEAVFTPVSGKDSIELTSLTITGMSLPDSLESRKTTITSEIQSEILSWKIRSTSKAIASATKSGPGSSMAPKDLKNTPPEIIIRERFAILIMIDGEPKLATREGTSYQYVKNSVVPIVYDPSNKTYYLPNGKDWYRTNDLKGTWTMTTDVPSDVRSLIKMDDTENVTKQNLEIVVATKPSELISFDGPAQWEPLPGSKLLYAKNTESDVFKDIATQLTYVLISGRWFSASTLKGPWTFVGSDKLPASFQEIPADGPKSSARASVAGTQEASQAVLDAIVPQTAAVDRSKATLTVTYDGDPWFQKIEGTSMEYAVNSTTPVIHVGNMYYACDNAIWFISPSPNGPWAVSDKRPEEIDKIPSSNPVSNVKYVYVYSSTPTVVYVGYTPGYYGTYIYGPTIVYGTGFYYNPWYGPHYYPRPYTYGFHFHYSHYYGWGGGYSYHHPPYHPMYGPGHRPPPYYGRPPGAYPRPPNAYNRPTNGNRPNVSPRVPTNAVNRPSTMPSTRPSTRPSTPTYRPSAPSQRPSTMPANRPMNQPSARPSMSRPSGGGGRRR